MNLLPWRAQRWGRYAPSRGAQLEQWRRPQDAAGGATTLDSALAPRRRSLSPSLPLLPNRTKAAVLILSLEPSSLKVSLQLPSLTKLYLLQPPPPCIGYAELPMSSCYNNGGRRPLLPSPFSTSDQAKRVRDCMEIQLLPSPAPLAAPSTIDLSFKSSAMADNVWSSSNESMCQAPDLFLNSNITSCPAQTLISL